MFFIGDGGTYDVGSSTNGTYNVQSGTLNILPGADVLYVSGSGNGASITMSGGQVETGISVDQGNLNISGGQSRGSDNSTFGGDAVFVSSSAQITGRTFIGGNSSGQAGSSGVGSAGTAYTAAIAEGKTFLSTLNISGGTLSLCSTYRLDHQDDGITTDGTRRSP